MKTGATGHATQDNMPEKQENALIWAHTERNYGF